MCTYISTDEDLGLRIQSFAVINLRGVSTNNSIICFIAMQTYKKLNFRLDFSLTWTWCSATVSKLGRVPKTTAIMTALFWFRIITRTSHISTPSSNETLHGLRFVLKIILLIKN
jgi:hypothetical protein